MMEKEREIFSHKMKDLSDKQEYELAAVRSRWNQELLDEKTRLENFYQDELRLWKEKNH
jgi:hypothetical protein